MAFFEIFMHPDNFNLKNIFNNLTKIELLFYNYNCKAAFKNALSKELLRLPHFFL